MSVILELTLEAGEFTLGRVLSGPPGMHLEVERIVPTGADVMPFVWATGDDHEAFEEKVRSHAAVAELRVLDRIGNSGLYRLQWHDEPTDLVRAIADADATVLEAVGNDSWVFRLRFHDHERLTRFHNFLLEEGLDVHIERTYTLTEENERGYRFDLSREQREALVLALRRGYFATPSEVSLEELAEELDISRQAVSKRIRRGNAKILQRVLLSSVADFD